MKDVVMKDQNEKVWGLTIFEMLEKIEKEKPYNLEDIGIMIEVLSDKETEKSIQRYLVKDIITLTNTDPECSAMIILDCYDEEIFDKLYRDEDPVYCVHAKTLKDTIKNIDRRESSSMYICIHTLVDEANSTIRIFPMYTENTNLAIAVGEETKDRLLMFVIDGNLDYFKNPENNNFKSNTLSMVYTIKERR